MCIESSVGPGAANGRADVTIVQVLLCLASSATGSGGGPAVDGGFGQETEKAIRAFQQTAMRVAVPDGRVAPGSPTLQKLADTIPPGLSPLKLRGIMPAASAPRVDTYWPHLDPAMQAYEINTPLRRAHFLAQIGHESGALRYAEEIASGQAYEHRADLGNTQPGDGQRFKGRGLIQLTGRANYEAYGQAKGRDFLGDDTSKALASDPAIAVDVAGWFWKTRGLNQLADTDDIEKVTRRINGGLTNLPDRKAYLLRSRFFRP